MYDTYLVLDGIARAAQAIPPTLTHTSEAWSVRLSSGTFVPSD